MAYFDEHRNCPQRVHKRACVNALGQWVFITADFFQEKYGSDWHYTSYAKKWLRTMDFSGDIFNLESLEGPAKGLLHPGVTRNAIEELNISRNYLASIVALNHMDSKGIAEFSSLRILDVSWNQIRACELHLPNLMELNLSHNYMETFPNPARTPSLVSFKISHNEISDSIRPYGKILRLRVLDISHNKISWKPSEFDKNISAFADHRALEDLTMYPNPFARFFHEYQLLTLDRCKKLLRLDGYEIDAHIRNDVVALSVDVLKVDYGKLDIIVSGKELEMKLPSPRRKEIPTEVPRFHVMLAALGKALESQDTAREGMDTFARLVHALENSTASHRSRLMYIEDEGVVEGGEVMWRRMTVAEETQETLEFRDAVRQIMDRYEGEQARMIELLIGLVKGACLQHRRLTSICIQLVADWIDSKAETGELTQQASNMLFQEIVLLAAPGMLGPCENPRLCREATKRPYKLETPPLSEQVKHWGTTSQIATAAALTEALAGFGNSGLRQRTVPPARAQVMGAALPLLCRESAEDRGPDQPFNNWGVYEDFDAAPIPDAVEADCIHIKNVSEARMRVVRQGYGGYVVEDTEDENMKQVYFKVQPPEYIHATRRRYRGRTLYVRPCATDKKHEEGGHEMEAWQLWTQSVNLLHIATCDRSHAAEAVTSYGMHKTVANLFLRDDGFVENWVARPSEDGTVRAAFTRVCHIALNLMEGEEPASRIALKYFTDQKLHIEIWTRLQKCMVSFSQKTVNDPELNCIILALVEVIVTMGVHEEAEAPVMLSLNEAGLQPFSELVSVAGQMQRQDPVIFCAALELIACFLESDSTRDIVVLEVSEKLKASSVLVPFLQAMYVDGAPNVKLMKMWRACVETYGGATEIFEDDRHDWKKLVPRISELEDPTMIRILIDILKLFELYSRHAKKDPTGTLQVMTEMLDTRGREHLLLNPDFGLINCRDLGVKQSCLAVLGHVVVNSPDQINLVEVGWMLQYVTPQSLDSPSRIRFETEVVQFICRLMKSSSELGKDFRRSNLIKTAIVNSFEVLIRGSSDLSRNADIKLELCRAVSRLLNTVSAEVMPTDIRRFMGKSDFQKKYIGVLQKQDASGDNHCFEDLMLTWPLRDVDDLLGPLVWGRRLKVRGYGNFYCTVRLADILCGQPDIDEETLEAHPVFDEGSWWLGQAPSVKILTRHTPDLFLSWVKAQERFIGSGGPDGLLEACEDYCRHSGGVIRGGKAVTLGYAYDMNVAYVLDQLSIAHQRLSEFKDDPTEEIQAEVQDEEEEPQVVSSNDDSQEFMELVTKHLELRLANLNTTAVYIFQTNLKQQSQSNRSSLAALAKVFGKHLCQNRDMMMSLYEASPSAWRELMSIPDLYYHNATLQTLDEVLDSAAVYRYPRQPAEDPHEVYETLCKAHCELKSILTDPHLVSSREAWISRVDGSNEPLSSGMVQFISDYDGHVYDLGVRTPDNIRREMHYNHWEDASSMMDISQLVIEYKDLTSLCMAISVLRQFGRLTIVSLRNRYDEPDELGDRGLHVHVQLQEGQICRLKLIANNQKTSWLSWQQTLLNDVSYTLRNELSDVGGELTEEMAMWLVWRISDTTLHAGDMVNLTNEEQIMGVHDGKVFGSTSCSPLQSRFVLQILDDVRRTGSHGGITLSTGTGTIKTMTAHGRIRAGESTSIIRAGGNQHWVSSNHSGTVTCLVRDVAQTEEFVEFSLRHADPRYSRHKHMLTEDMDCMKTMDFVNIRVADTGKYLTMKRSPQSLGVFASDDTSTVRAMAARAQMAAWQKFQVSRVGSMLRMLKALGNTSALEFMRETAKPSEEEVVYESLARAYMYKPTYAFIRGNHNVAPTPGFDMLCRRQTNRLDWDAEHPTKHTRRHRRFTAAVLRTFYSLLVIPSRMDHREVILDIMWGTLESGTMALPQLVAMVLAAQQKPGGGLNLCDAWLTAKLLRFFGALLFVVPPAFQSHQRGLEEATRETEFAPFQIYSKKTRSFRSYHHQRIIILDLCASYMRAICTKSLGERLAFARERMLNLQEVVLLREFARAVCGLVRCHNGCAFRPATLATKTRASARRYFKGAAKERAKYFSDSLGDASKSVLVQAFLYGVNGEAQAYQSAGFSSEVRPTLRALTSLVNWTTHALSNVMAQCSASPESDCQYEMCEAISAASVHGLQVVPRTRVNGLMRERATDSLAAKVDEVIYLRVMEEYFNEESVWSGRAESRLGKKREPTHESSQLGFLEVAHNEKTPQRCETLAFCWVGSPGSADLVRRVVATTSGHFFVICKLPSGVADQDVKPEQIQVETVQPLSTLSRLVVCRRMRQFCGVWWGSTQHEPQTPGDESDSFLPKRQILIFETSMRRRFFLQAVQSVSRKHALFGESVPVCHVKDDVHNMIAVSASHDRLRRNGLLAAFFIKPNKLISPHPDVLVLTTHSVGFFAAHDIIQMFSVDPAEDPYYSQRPDGENGQGHLYDAESDSDVDEMPEFVDQSPVPKPLPRQRNGPFPLRGLKGVCIPKEEEAEVRLKFDEEIAVEFYSEVDRQRFREFLALALMSPDRRVMRRGSRNPRSRGAAWAAKTGVKF